MKKPFFKSLFIYGFWIALIFLFYHCPFKFVFKTDCPACGLTRAYKSLLKFDIKKAFYYHPLFPIPIIVLLYHFFRDKFNLKPKTEMIILLSLIAVFIVSWIIKII